MDAETPPSAAPIISISFDLRAVVRIALVWAAEYAMLSLIEDAPETVKVATLVCAVLALVIMQFEAWLRTVRKNAFRNALTAVAFVYAGFIAFAVQHVSHESWVKAQTNNWYVKGRLIQKSVIPIDGTTNKPSQEAISAMGDNLHKWEDDVSAWLAANLGDAAEAKFLDHNNCLFMNWSISYRDAHAFDQKYDIVMNQLGCDERNLATIIETHAYGP